MSVSKIKTLAIAALLLINAFFLTMIILDNAADARIEHEAIENVCAILRANGIHVNLGDVDTNGSLWSVRTMRDDGSEALIAEMFLGETIIIDQGVILLYENEERGTAEFARAGDFEITLNAGAITSSGDALRTALGLLRDMGIETSAPVSVAGQGSEVIKAVSSFNGLEIFNCPIEFVFSGDSLEVAKGRYVTGMEIAEDGKQISSASTALLGFLAAVTRGEQDCTQIYSVQAGYHHTAIGPFGEGMLSPAWLLETDTGRYIVDDSTGEVRGG